MAIAICFHRMNIGNHRWSQATPRWPFVERNDGRARFQILSSSTVSHYRQPLLTLRPVVLHWIGRVQNRHQRWRAVQQQGKSSGKSSHREQMLLLKGLLEKKDGGCFQLENCWIITMLMKHAISCGSEILWDFPKLCILLYYFAARVLVNAEMMGHQWEFVFQFVLFTWLDLIYSFSELLKDYFHS